MNQFQNEGEKEKERGFADLLGRDFVTQRLDGARKSYMLFYLWVGIAEEIVFFCTDRNEKAPEHLSTICTHAM